MYLDVYFCLHMYVYMFLQIIYIYIYIYVFIHTLCFMYAYMHVTVIHSFRVCIYAISRYTHNSCVITRFDCELVTKKKILRL